MLRWLCCGFLQLCGCFSSDLCLIDSYCVRTNVAPPLSSFCSLLPIFNGDWEHETVRMPCASFSPSSFSFFAFFFLCWSQCDSLMICSLTTHIVFPALTVVAFSFLSFPFLFRFFLCPLTLRHKGGRFSHTVGVCNPPVVVIVRSLSPTPKQYLRFLPVFFSLPFHICIISPRVCVFFSLCLFSSIAPTSCCGAASNELHIFVDP